MKARLHIFYSGRVQGVGFRASVKQIACGYEVVGWVKNLPDGRVEMVAEGDKSELEAFLKGISESYLNSFIHDQAADWLGSQGDLKSFHIAY
ncbi:MAG: acylphosphatase [Verrucomicrobiae bacterium]|nr:acylphosphatase [Verrucomicrobiae bacterium]